MPCPVLKTCPLFKDISETDIQSLLNCLSAVSRDFPRDSYVFRAGERVTHVGIVLSGSVHVIQEDFWGNRTILSPILPGGLFGEAFSCAETEHLPVSVVAAAESRILLIDYKKIITTCQSSCVFHLTLVKNMLKVLAEKNLLLTGKMSHMSKKTTREKILSYLSAQAVSGGNSRIVIPFNRQELADYLSVERSALSRQLSLMEAEGLISYHKNEFTLHDL